MEFNNTKINNLMNEWMLFRDESLCKLLPEDKEHIINFNKFFDNILKNVSPSNKKYVKKQLNKLNENYLDYIGHWNEKYYKSGFGDCLNLVIMSLGGNDIETR